MSDPIDLRQDRLLDVCRLLNAEEAHYVVVGGYACLLQGLVRTTKDVDVLIPSTMENAERVHRALCRLPLGLAKELTVAELLSKPFTILGDRPRVDLLLAAGKLRWFEAWSTHEEKIVEGVRVPYASIDALILSKDTGRLRDQADTEELRFLKNRRAPPA